MAAPAHSATARRANKAPATGPSREPLSHALGTRAKVCCLRTLSTTSGDLSQREVARRSGTQHRSAQRALDELVALGLVRRIMGSREFLVSLSDDHHLSAPIRTMFQSEAEFFLALRRDLAAIAAQGPHKTRFLSLTLFGSIARGDDTATSDVDLLLITADGAASERALASIATAADQLRKRYGYSIRPIAYTLTDARRRWRRREAPFPEIARDHVVLVGPPLRELLHGTE